MRRQRGVRHRSAWSRVPERIRFVEACSGPITIPPWTPVTGSTTSTVFRRTTITATSLAPASADQLSRIKHSSSSCSKGSATSSGRMRSVPHSQIWRARGYSDIFPVPITAMRVVPAPRSIGMATRSGPRVQQGIWLRSIYSVIARSMAPLWLIVGLFVIRCVRRSVTAHTYRRRCGECHGRMSSPPRQLVSPRQTV